MPHAGIAGAHPAVVEAEEVQPLTSLVEVHDPRLGLLGFKAQLRQERPKRHECRFGLAFGLAHNDEIVGVTAQHAVPAPLPLPVEPVQVDVAEHGRDHPALRRARSGTSDSPVHHGPGVQHRAQELQQVAVDDPFLDGRHQPVVRDRFEAVRDVRLYHPASAPPRLIDEHLEGVVR